MMFDLSYSVKGEDEPFKMKFEEATAGGFGLGVLGFRGFGVLFGV